MRIKGSRDDKYSVHELPYHTAINFNVHNTFYFGVLMSLVDKINPLAEYQGKWVGIKWPDFLKEECLLEVDKTKIYWVTKGVRTENHGWHTNYFLEVMEKGLLEKVNPLAPYQGKWRATWWGNYTDGPTYLEVSGDLIYCNSGGNSVVQKKEGAVRWEGWTYAAFFKSMADGCLVRHYPTPEQRLKELEGTFWESPKNRYKLIDGKLMTLSSIKGTVLCKSFIFETTEDVCAAIDCGKLTQVVEPTKLVVDPIVERLRKLEGTRWNLKTATGSSAESVYWKVVNGKPVAWDGDNDSAYYTNGPYVGQFLGNFVRDIDCGCLRACNVDGSLITTVEERMKELEGTKWVKYIGMPDNMHWVVKDGIVLAYFAGDYPLSGDYKDREKFLKEVDNKELITWVESVEAQMKKLEGTKWTAIKHSSAHGYYFVENGRVWYRSISGNVNEAYTYGVNWFLSHLDQGKYFPWSDPIAERLLKLEGTRWTSASLSMSADYYFVKNGKIGYHFAGGSDSDYVLQSGKIFLESIDQGRLIARVEPEPAPKPKNKYRVYAYNSYRSSHSTEKRFVESADAHSYAIQLLYVEGVPRDTTIEFEMDNKDGYQWHWRHAGYGKFVAVNVL